MINDGDKVRIIRPERLCSDCFEWVENFLFPVKKEEDEIMGEPAVLNSIGKVICSGIYSGNGESALLYGVRIGKRIYIMYTDGIRKV